MQDEKTQINQSTFTLITILLSFSSLLIMSVWAYNTSNLKGIILAVIFTLFLIGGLIFSLMNKKVNLLEYGRFGQASFWFSVGFLIWLFLGSTKGSTLGSVLSFPQNYLFASISGELPLFTEFALNTFGIPFAEETFFMIGIPSLLAGIFALYKDKINVWVQILIISLITGFSFALFHTAKFTLSFLIFALIFRTIGNLMVIGDQLTNWFKWGEVTVTFMLGAHVGNNWGYAGIGNGFNLIFNNLIEGNLVAITIVLFLSVTFIFAIDYLAKKIFKNEVRQ